MAGDLAFDADKKPKSFPGNIEWGNWVSSRSLEIRRILRPSEYGNGKRTAAMPLNFARGITRGPWSSMKSFQREQKWCAPRSGRSGVLKKDLTDPTLLEMERVRNHSPKTAIPLRPRHRIPACGGRKAGRVVVKTIRCGSTIATPPWATIQQENPARPNATQS